MKICRMAAGIIFILIILCCGCIQQNIQNANASQSTRMSQTQTTMNTSLHQFDNLYTDPIGGFQETNFMPVSPGNSYKTTYVLYTRDWGPGEVDYSITNWEGRPLTETDGIHVSIEPSHMVVQPHSSYVSQVNITTNPHLKESTAFRLKAQIGNQEFYCDDSISLNTMIVPGMSIMSIDREIVDNATVLNLKQDEITAINLSFLKGNAGIHEISYEIPQTPLNITIIPASFIAKRNSGNYPAVITVVADKNVLPGSYTFIVKVDGGHDLTPSEFLFRANVSGPKTE